MEQPETTIDEAKAFFEKLDDEEAEQELYRMHWIEDNRSKYEPALEKAVRYHLQSLLKRAEEQIPRLEEKYNDMVKHGVPFLERKGLGDKIERAYTAREIYKEDLQNLKVKTLDSWITYDDIKQIELKGFLNVVGNPYVLQNTYEARNSTT